MAAQDESWSQSAAALASNDRAVSAGSLRRRLHREFHPGECIFETTHAPGYLVDQTRYFCLRCVESIGRGPFEYADEYTDALVEFVPNRRFPPNSYIRYSLGAKGDSDCETWPSQVNAEILLSKAGVKENECVRVNLLPERPSGYALVNSVPVRSCSAVCRMTIGTILALLFAAWGRVSVVWNFVDSRSLIVQHTEK